MSPRAIAWILLLLAALAAIGTAWLFWVQNSARRVMLSLNLGLTKLSLAEPVPVPVLMAVCLLVGFVLGLALVLALRTRRSGRAPSDNPYLQSSMDSAEGEQAW